MQARSLKASRQICMRHHPLDFILLNLHDFESVLRLAKALFLQDLVQDKFSEILDGFVAFDSELVKRAALAYVCRYPDEVFRDKFYLWDWKTDIHKRFKRYRQMVTIWLRAPHRWFELSVHQVDDDRLWSFEMCFPRFQARLLVVLPVRFDSGHEWFYFDSVEVFVETVKDNREQLLRILLLCIGELLLEPSENAFEFEWYHDWVFTWP